MIQKLNSNCDLAAVLPVVYWAGPLKLLFPKFKFATGAPKPNTPPLLAVTAVSALKVAKPPNGLVC